MKNYKEMKTGNSVGKWREDQMPKSRGNVPNASAAEINNIFLDSTRRIKTWSQEKQKKMVSFCLPLGRGLRGQHHKK